MKTAQIVTIENIVGYIRSAGRMAFREQKKGAIPRDYKTDGSVITPIDRKVEDYLHAKISAIFPDANILSEETARFFDTEKAYTFVIDPIDGTDAFSQGMHGWCVSVGLMKGFIPVAGVIYSPPLDLLLFADIDQEAKLNGQPLVYPGNASLPISPKTNIMVSSSLHQQINLGKYPGKFRSIGSAALHTCFPLVYPGIYAAIESRHVHIWDILASHAICSSHNFALELYAGGEVNYSGLTDGSSVGDLVLSGLRTNIENLRKIWA
jgi:fructose-1,6-bisphosphatase/inositol monophosphatase family enzyme